MYTLKTNKKLRLLTLCILYFAQGFPWGFMLTALISFLASKGLTMAESGQLAAMAYLPWTFKLFWGPLIDSFNYKPMGKRRPWILFAQFGMLATLLMMALMGNLLSNLTLLGWMFFLHNCFASLQDVSCDALAVDILRPEEQGKVNGAMWGAKVIGTGFGAVVMGTVLVSHGFVFSILLQSLLMGVIILFPLFIKEKPNEKRFPWSKEIVVPQLEASNIQNPLNIIKNLVKAFSVKPAFIAGIFILLSALNQGVNSGVLPVFYNTTLGWEPDVYSQISGGPGAVLEFFGAILGGLLADKYGRRKIFFIGWGSFSLLSGLFGISILMYEQIPYWIQIFYLVVYPAFIALGTVAMFSLAMALSWSKASATMFTSYMAISNLSVVIGSKLIEPLTSFFTLGYIYLFMMIICLLPAFLLKHMNPQSILEMKINSNSKD
ncbi:MFS transporter [Candidatus Marinimicrobia bacterium]|nr:MFS transporter [Candidatus Neomarinimicrobiota bacterium]